MKGKIFIPALLLVLWSCNSDNNEIEDTINETSISETLNLPDDHYNYTNLALPEHFTRGVDNINNSPNNNPVTDAGATLGRVLFYDVKLSANNTISCASCHVQSAGFSDSNRLSEGFEGGLTGRNSMGLSNAKYYDNGRFFWDERAATLEDQVLMPIQDEVEMGLTLNELVSKIAEADYYTPLFEDAFGSEEVTSNKISLALSQFIRSMVSYNSQFDEGLSAAGDIEDDFSNFSELENLGKDLFFSGRTQCANCHETAVFSGDEARNNGLDAGFPDLGLGAVTGNENDNGKFKVNSLRNIELTAPFMHDGRFETLRDVIRFYNNGIQNNPNLDNRLRVDNGRVRRMNLNGNEIDALVAFLNTLTDEEFVTDEKFSNPFAQQE